MPLPNLLAPRRLRIDTANDLHGERSVNSTLFFPEIYLGISYGVDFMAGALECLG